MGRSSGPQKADFTKCEIKDGAPTGSEYGEVTTSVSKTQRMPLPSGPAGDQAKGGGIPEAELTPGIRHSGERGSKGRSDKSKY
jgi:hypothetical protein